MADPLSVAGLAAGVVSLGIQLCGTIQTYLDGVKAHADELRAVRRQITEAQNLLAIIQDQTDNLGGGYTKASRAARSSADSCQEQIQTLDEFVAKITSTKSASGSSGFRDRMQDKGRRLLYPFHRPILESLESRLDRLNGSLQAALQVLDLGVTSNIDQKVTEMHAFFSELNRSGMQISLQHRTLDSGPVVPGFQTNGGQTVTGLGSAAALTPTSSSDLRALNMAPSSCYCRSKQLWSMSVRRWGYWSVFHEELLTEPHIPSCRHARTTMPEQTKKSGVEYTGLVRMMNIAFRLSLFTMAETGGNHIGPLFTYYPVVDERTAPVFKILDMTKDALYRHRFSVLPVQMSLDLMRHCVTRVMSIYSSSKFSPRSVDSRGRTAMHALIETMWEASRIILVISGYRVVRLSKLGGAFESLCENAVHDLIRAGVPSMRHDAAGQSPASLMITSLSSFSGSLFSSRLMTTLISADHGSSQVWTRGNRTTRFVSHSFAADEIFKENQELAEACGCGPLIMAACKGDATTAARILARDTNYLRETNLFEQNPLHLGIRYPQLLQVLIDSGRPSQLELDSRDNSGRTPLDYAVMYGEVRCAEILLKAGCSSDLGSLGIIDDMRMFDMILRNIKERRDRLKFLAIQNLPLSELEEMRLSEDRTLDLHTKAVQQKLVSLGVSVSTGISFQSQSPFSNTVYEYSYLSVPMLESLWAYGFRDLDEPNREGNPPIVGRAFRMGEFDNDFERMSWFLQHGASVSTPVSTPVSAIRSSDKSSDEPTHYWTTAHILAANIGGWWSERHHDPDKLTKCAAARSVADMCLSLSREDRCYCICSRGGCTPHTMLLKWLCSDYERFLWKSRSQIGISKAMGSFFAVMNPPAFIKQDYEQAIRTATFYALETRHTCCKGDWEGFPEQGQDSIEEIREINSEQGELLGRIDDLVETLSIEFFETPDEGGKPLGLTDPEEFWTRRWLPRVEGANRELNSRTLTQSEIDEAEDIGVKWEQLDAAAGVSEDEEDSEFDSSEDEEDSGFDFDDFRRRVDEIASGA